jgi:hypothetical protein
MPMAKMHPTAPASPMRLQQIPGVPDGPPGDPTPGPDAHAERAAYGNPAHGRLTGGAL